MGTAIVFSWLYFKWKIMSAADRLYLSIAGYLVKGWKDRGNIVFFLAPESAFLAQG